MKKTIAAMAICAMSLSTPADAQETPGVLAGTGLGTAGTIGVIAAVLVLAVALGGSDDATTSSSGTP